MGHTHALPVIVGRVYCFSQTDQRRGQAIRRSGFHHVHQQTACTLVVGQLSGKFLVVLCPLAALRYPLW